MSIEDIEDELTSSIRNIKLLLPNMSKEVESEFDTMEIMFQIYHFIMKSQLN